MALRKYIIERDIPNVGTLEREQLREAAAQSNAVLNQLAPDIQWVESYVAGDKTFCVYLAKDESLINKHAEMVAVSRRRKSLRFARRSIRRPNIPANQVVRGGL